MGWLTPNREYHLVTTGTQALDPSTYTGAHMDILSATTLSTSANSADGQLYTMVLDSDPSNTHVVTFGTGFRTTGTVSCTGGEFYTTLLFLGHDNLLVELCRSANIAA